MSPFIRTPLLALAGLVLASRLAAAAALPVVVEVQSSKGIQPGDPVLADGEAIGEVTDVGFGERSVEIRLAIESDARRTVRRDSIFGVTESSDGKRSVEHFPGKASSPAATAGERFRGADDIADVWLRRGRITSQELGIAMSQGIEGLRRSIDRLKRSPEWPKFRDQVARLAAQMTVAQTELSRMIERAIPALGRELDTAYEEYQKELRKQELQRRPED